jgi:hypothetical protein
VPQTKIILHYFAGKCSKDNLYFNYDSLELGEAEKMTFIIKTGIREKLNKTG